MMKIPTQAPSSTTQEIDAEDVADILQGFKKKTRVMANWDVFVGNHPIFGLAYLMICGVTGKGLVFPATA